MTSTNNRTPIAPPAPGGSVAARTPSPPCADADSAVALANQAPVGDTSSPHPPPTALFPPPPPPPPPHHHHHHHHAVTPAAAAILVSQSSLSSSSPRRRAAAAAAIAADATASLPATEHPLPPQDALALTSALKRISRSKNAPRILTSVISAIVRTLPTRLEDLGRIEGCRPKTKCYKNNGEAIVAAVNTAIENSSNGTASSIVTPSIQPSTRTASSSLSSRETQQALLLLTNRSVFVYDIRHPLVDKAPLSEEAFSKGPLSKVMTAVNNNFDLRRGSYRTPPRSSARREAAGVAEGSYTLGLNRLNVEDAFRAENESEVTLLVPDATWKRSNSQCKWQPLPKADRWMDIPAFRSTLSGRSIGYNVVYNVRHLVFRGTIQNPLVTSKKPIDGITKGNFNVDTMTVAQSYCKVHVDTMLISYCKVHVDTMLITLW